jgi:hypothetical protein
MKNRNGEKVGWIGGWLGGFLWVLVLAVVFLFQNKLEKGGLGLALFAIAGLFIFFFAPWKRPDTPYWTLMLPLYFLFFSVAGWAIWAFSGWKASSLNWWNVFWVLPMLMPMFTAGQRTWNDSSPVQKK